MGILSATAEARKLDFGRLAQQAVADGGPGLLRQSLQILGLRLGHRKFSPEEYYDYGLFRPGKRREARRTYLPMAENSAFNAGLTGPAYEAHAAVFIDKLEVERRLSAEGLPVARSRAYVTTGEVPDHAPNPLGSPEEVVRFLSDPSHHPLFGKPRASSFSLGAALFERPGEDEGTLVLGNGTTVEIEALATEICTDWGDGYLLQDQLRNHADLRRHLGPATGLLRVVTLLAESGPEVLYAVQRLPSPSAMHDNATTGMRAHAGIDLATGKVAHIGVFGRGGARKRLNWMLPDEALVGMRLPFFDEAMDLARSVHRLFPKLALVGADIALTDDGPVVVELNSNPWATTYQAGFDRGLLIPDTLARFDAARRLAMAAQ